MGKKANHKARPNRSGERAGGTAERTDKPATIKDMLKADVLDKLKAQADALRAEEERRRQEAAREAEERRKAEQKRRENDFAYLLENSKMDWKSFK